MKIFHPIDDTIWEDVPSETIRVSVSGGDNPNPLHVYDYCNIQSYDDLAPVIETLQRFADAGFKVSSVDSGEISVFRTETESEAMQRHQAYCEARAATEVALAAIHQRLALRYNEKLATLNDDPVYTEYLRLKSEIVKRGFVV